MARNNEKSDPTVTSSKAEPSEGSHELRPLEETTDAASNLRYEEAKDKPDPTTVAQVQIREGE